ncbi:MAG TPA: c-type cytochrome [Methylophilaceae bacterium]|nr:c-type cytochrome [Methylophilaceae bacterium]
MKALIRQSVKVRAVHPRPVTLFCCLMLMFTASAFGGTATPESPDAKQLMEMNVGETRIPRTSTPPNLRNPYQGDPKAVAQGQTLYSAMNCIGCHAPQGGGGMGPPLSDDVWIYGSEPAQVYLSIVQGRPNGMPSFAKALPPEAIWQLVSYVRSLASDSPGQPVKDLPKSKQTDK